MARNGGASWCALSGGIEWQAVLRAVRIVTVVNGSVRQEWR